MPRTIMGLETRACINGLNKTDFENVKKIPTLESETNEIKNDTIPSLDDRITALEQSSGGNDYSWSEEPVIFETFSGISDVINDYFDYDEENESYTLKYDTIVSFEGQEKFVPKGFNYFELYMEIIRIDNTIQENLRIDVIKFNPQEFFFFEPQDDTKFYRSYCRWIISNPSQTTFTFNNYSGEESRQGVFFYFKNKVSNS